MLVPLLLFQNEEAIAESVRAYGNFSRDEKVRALMAEKRRKYQLQYKHDVIIRSLRYFRKEHLEAFAVPRLGKLGENSVL